MIRGLYPKKFFLRNLQTVWPDEGIKNNQNFPKSCPKVATSKYIQIVTLLKWPKKFQDIWAIIAGSQGHQDLSKIAQFDHTVYGSIIYGQILTINFLVNWKKSIVTIVWTKINPKKLYGAGLKKGCVAECAYNHRKSKYFWSCIKETQFWALVVVKWSACSPSTPTIRVWIPLRSTIFL